MNFSDFLSRIELNDSKRNILLQSKRILSFSPHPDDTEIMAAGFISQRIRDGAAFQLVVVSDGRKGSRTIGEEELKSIRKEETKEAMAILGVNDIIFLEHKDSEVPGAEVLRNDMIKIMREFSPDLVITVDPFLTYESHPDHINTGFAVLQSVLFLEFPNIGKGNPTKRPNVALGFTSSPNVIIDCSSSIEKKINSIRAHKSQFPDEASIDIIKRISSLYGKRIGAEYGEAFKVLFPSELHINVLGEMNPI